jgi:general secretion pathway protein D
MDYFSSGKFKWIRKASRACLLVALSGLLCPLTSRAESGGSFSGRVSLDFNDVELSVFVRFISELTGKNFVLDDVVKKAGGKISVYSPTKVTHDQAYSMFVAALEVSRLAVVPKGNVNQIVAMGDLPPERGAFVYKLRPISSPDLRQWHKRRKAREHSSGP